MNQPFVMVRKSKDYKQKTTNPKITTDAETYQLLANVALESGFTVAEVARQAIRYALDHLEWVEEGG